MLPKNLGTYTAVAKKWGVERKDSGCPKWNCEFRLLTFFNGENWEDVEGDLSITAYLTLVNTDRSVNKINVKQIGQAYELPEVDFDVLTNHDFTEKQVQLVIDEHTYEGKTKLEVRYLNHFDYQGRSLASDPVVVKSLQAEFGALLRAESKNVAVKPAAKTPVKPSVAKAPVATPLQTAQRGAWMAFCERTVNLEKDARLALWKRSLEMYGPKGVAPAAWNVENWEVVTTIIAAKGAYEEPIDPPMDMPVQEAAPEEALAPAIMDEDIPF